MGRWLLRLADVQRQRLLRELAAVSSQRLLAGITVRPPLAANGANSGQVRVNPPRGDLTPCLEVGPMDDRRFDGLTRVLAAADSRRLLRAAVVAVPAMLALPGGAETAAHHAKTPLGGAFRHTSRCLHHAVVTRRVSGRSSRQAVYCAENGFRYDGALNCCRYAGGSCQRDEQCCGSRHFCRSRVCRYLR